MYVNVVHKMFHILYQSHIWDIYGCVSVCVCRGGGVSKIPESPVQYWHPPHEAIRSWLVYTLLPVHGYVFSCFLHTKWYSFVLYFCILLCFAFIWLHMIISNGEIKIFNQLSGALSESNVFRYTWFKTSTKICDHIHPSVTLTDLCRAAGKRAVGKTKRLLMASLANSVLCNRLSVWFIIRNKIYIVYIYILL